jgi:Kdo2-lipid IVA lauroyltransferase/acyltransferase
MAQRRLKAFTDTIIGAVAVGLLRSVKFLDRQRTANLAARLLRRLGPLFKEHRIGRENLRAAYPEKSDAEIEQILAGVWDNLGRLSVEFAHLDEFHLSSAEPATANDLTFTAQTYERAERVLNGGTAVICFAAHLANWELSAVAAKLLASQTAVLYRRPNIGAISDTVLKLRRPLMGELVATGLDAPVRLARLLQAGVHIGMLADQHFTRGVEVTFFGRRCLANPLVALLARQTGCPMHGLRMIRCADHNSFRIEMSDAIEPARDADGRVDIAGTMQAITSVIEGWVREYPEQWLWLHQRWR